MTPSILTFACDIQSTGIEHIAQIRFSDNKYRARIVWADLFQKHSLKRLEQHPFSALLFQSLSRTLYFQTVFCKPCKHGPFWCENAGKSQHIPVKINPSELHAPRLLAQYHPWNVVQSIQSISNTGAHKNITILRSLLCAVIQTAMLMHTVIPTKRVRMFSGTFDKSAERGCGTMNVAQWWWRKTNTAMSYDFWQLFF